MAGLLVLGIAHALQRRLVEPMIPAFHNAVRLLAAEFDVRSEEIVQDGPNEVFRVQANLSVPITYAGHQLYPPGWNGAPERERQVSLALNGVLEYSSLLLIFVIGWPARGMKELVLRLALSVPLAMVLLVVDVPFTIVAYLWSGIRDVVDPNGFCGWMVWSRFLKGGGGLALSCFMGATVILMARGLTDRRPRPRHGGRARDGRHETGFARLALPRAKAASES